MALITCYKCGKHISDKAIACPGCGRLVNSKSRQNHIPPYNSDSTTTTNGRSKYSTTKKESNPGDAVAEAEKIKMKAEAEAKAKTKTKTKTKTMRDNGTTQPKAHQQNTATNYTDHSSSFGGFFTLLAVILMFVAVCAFPVGGIPLLLIAAIRIFAYAGKD